MPDHIIVMGDVVGSRVLDGQEMIGDFKRLISSCNEELSSCLLSPYTITLGDEFQGIAKSLCCSVQSLFYLEESILKLRIPFRLRYVVHRGEIVTPLNPEIAYEMVGPGLARAREILTDKRQRRPRFVFDLPDETLSADLNRLFAVIESLVQDWHEKDFGLVADLISNANDSEVAASHHKNRSQIWKRRRNLRIGDYEALKQVCLDLSMRGLG